MKRSRIALVAVVVVVVLSFLLSKLVSPPASKPAPLVTAASRRLTDGEMTRVLALTSGVWALHPASKPAPGGGARAAHAITDGALARAVVDDLSIAFRGQGLREIGPDVAGRCLPPGRRVRVASPVFEAHARQWTRVEIVLGVDVYSDRSAARKAFRVLGGEPYKACQATSYVAGLRKQHVYHPGRPDIVPSKTVQAGVTARANDIIIPAKYKGYPLRFNLDVVVGVKGRFVVWASSVSFFSLVSVDEKGVRQLVQGLSFVRQEQAATESTRVAATSG
jgi:hypothetical protein